MIQLFKYSLPVLTGYIPVGIAFGFLMRNEGFAWYIAPLCSLLIFAGALQFFAVSLFLTAGVPWLDVVLATLTINFRHIFYGFSVFNYLPRQSAQKWYFIHALTDENYSLLTSKLPLQQSQAFWLLMLNHSYWVIGTLLGGLLASFVQPIAGIDFVLVVLFLVLLLEQLYNNPSIMTPLLALLACLFSSVFFKAHFLIAATVSCFLLLFLQYQMAIRGKTDE
ncbi:MAG: branched-chain amino acid transporter AzlC [Gammaproteobacteria bacterium]|nr:MAG: branched-chain amino acid transporter AzlC [Gammaproteobacteria bacterium]